MSPQLLPPFPHSSRFSDLSDRDLLDRCERYGREALVWRNRFRALLPEVARRKLYLQKGYPSIYVFGKILAGLSEEQVSESLNIASRLHDKPALRGLLERGDVSINKISRVMAIATPENEGELAEKVQILSVGALNVMVQDIKREVRQESDEAEFLDVQKPERKIFFAQDGKMSDLGLSSEVMRKLRELTDRGIDINETLMEFLEQRERQLEQKKEEIARELAEKQTGTGRYVPKKIRDVVKAEYGKKCAKHGCSKPSQELHHTARYSVTKSHDPHFLAPLCHEHHELAHKMDVRVVECAMGK